MEPIRVVRRPTVVRRLLRAARVNAAVLAVGLVAAVTVFGVAAPPAGAETTLTVQAGYSGRFAPGKPVPVRVTVGADRLLRGSLDFSVEPADPAAVTVSVPLEVPGGSVKQVVVAVDMPATFEQAVVHVVFHGSGESVQGQSALAFSDDQELVGLLPAVTPATLPGSTPLTIDAGTARFAALDDLLLAAAPASLAPLGTIVAGPDELAGLAPAARQGILAWVDDGGHLLVDATAGTAVAGLPDEWQPGSAARVSAGGGEIRLTAGAAAAQRWSSIIEPTPTASPNQKSNSPSQFFSPEGLSDSVAVDAGLQVAKLGWLLGFLVIYVLVVGPIVFFVLWRVRRPDLAWVVIPAVALVFTAISYVAGSDLRSGTRTAHGSVVVSGPEGAVERTWIGFVSRNGGDGSVTFPTGWTAGAVDVSFTGGSTSPVAVSDGGTSIVGRVRLDAGQFGIVAGEGPVTDGDRLVVTATSTEDSQASGTVRNATAYDLSGVVVFVGRSVARIGSLAAGATMPWSVGRGDIVDEFTAPENVAWPAESGFAGAPIADSAVSVALWQQEVQRTGADYHTTGTAVAVGWTRDAASAGQTGGKTVSEGRTAIVGRTAVQGKDGAWGSLAVRRDLLRLPVDVVEVGGVATTTAMLRFALPATAADPGPLALSVPLSVTGVEVWTGAAWTTVPMTGASSNPNLSGTRSVSLPAAALADGVVYARLKISLQNAPFSTTAVELLHGATS
jgi:hypothetical protein